MKIPVTAETGAYHRPMKRTLIATGLLLAAACAGGDDDAITTTAPVATAPAATTTAPLPPTTTTTSTSTTTTTTTTTTTAPTTTTTLDPIVEAAARLVGTHIGQWINETFGSVGAATFTVGEASGEGEVEIVLDLDGSVFGFPDPAAETITVRLTDLRDGITVETDLFGSLEILVTADGRLEVAAAAVPVPGIATFRATAVFGDTAITGEYVVEFEGAGSAGGVFEVALGG